MEPKTEAAPARPAQRPPGQLADTLAGAAMLVVALLVASPAVLGLVELAIPYLAWLALLVVLLASLLATVTLPARRGRTLAVYAIAMLASWALVLTADSGGLLLVLLVLVAAVGAYAVPAWATATAVGLNVVVAAVATHASAGAIVETVLVAGFYLLIQVAAVLSSTALLQERSTRRALTAAHVELRAATIERAEAARTAERLRISRELHDAIGHELTVLTLQLETAKHLDGDAAREHLEQADRVARALLAEVRGTVGSLRAEAPDLEAALREMTAALPGLDVRIAVDPGVRVDDAERAALLRAAQEIVTNTIRHAEASALELTVRAEGGCTVLEGRDDGRGEARPRLGNGLRGLQERIAELGGEVRIDGRRGFAVVARVPSA